MENERANKLGKELEHERVNELKNERANELGNELEHERVNELKTNGQTNWNTKGLIN